MSRMEGLTWKIYIRFILKIFMCKGGYFCAAPWYTNMAMDKWVTFRTCISHHVLHFCRKDPKRIVVYWEKIGPLEWCISALRNIWVFQKYGYPQIIHFNRVFHYKPSILGYPFFWKHPCMYIYIYIKKKYPFRSLKEHPPHDERNHQGALIRRFV